MIEAIVKDEIEKEYEYKLDKRDRKPRSVKAAQEMMYWKLMSLNN